MNYFDDMAAEGIDGSTYYVHITGPADLEMSAAPAAALWVWVTTFGLFRKVQVGDKIMLEGTALNNQFSQHWTVEQALNPEGAQELQKIRLVPKLDDSAVRLYRGDRLFVIPHK